MAASRNWIPAALIAAAFDHWDTRSGDPQLHTHVVVANRVQGPDGAWRTLDGRVLYRAAVAMSEIHNVLLADNLSRRLGVNWELRERGSRRNPAFEIDAIPDELIREFSARTEQIEANLSALLDERSDQIHPPGRREMYALRQQATLMNRPSKHLAQPLAALMAQWRKRADQAIGHDAVAAIQRSLNAAGERPLAAADLSPETHRGVRRRDRPDTANQARDLDPLEPPRRGRTPNPAAPLRLHQRPVRRAAGDRRTRRAALDQPHGTRPGDHPRHPRQRRERVHDPQRPDLHLTRHPRRRSRSCSTWPATPHGPTIAPATDPHAPV